MDLNLKQWRYQQQQQQQQHHESGLQQPPAKLPKLFLDLQLQEQTQHPPGSSALPLFVPESTASLPKMGSYFSMAQWQELELQALIFRHMLAGAAVPPELLHLLKKSLLNTCPSPASSLYLQHYSSYHPALFPSGYWGRASLDPEPGRCRRTDGKKWRCSREVVAGHKYCERHMHRGRNRSRKPVEIPTPSAAVTAGTNGGGCGSGGALKTNSSRDAQPLTAMAAGGTHFDLSGPSPSIDLLNLNPRSTNSSTEKKGPFEAQIEVPGPAQSGSRVLRRFFDDWPRSLQELEDAGGNASPVASSTGLSISTPDNPASDFSLKLSTGYGDEPGHLREGSRGRGRIQVNWAGGWGAHPAGPVGGPLAEALRSSTSNCSPTSVLHQMPPPRSTISETSYVSS